MASSALVTITAVTQLAVSFAASGLAPCTTCKGPVWSWNTFPAFFHGSDPNGTAGGGFTEAALDTITQFPIVTVIYRDLLPRQTSSLRRMDI